MSDGYTTRFHATTPADAVSPAQPNEVIPFNQRFNGASWDRERGNVEATLLASAARTAATQSPDQTNYNGRGVQVILNVSAASGTGGLQVVVQGKDPVSGSYYNLYAAPTAVTATGIKVYEVAPGASSAGAGDVATRVAGQLPRTWRVNVLVGDSSSYTYSIGAAVIN
ncbi:MAG TPA: hypothetical protein VFC63_09825 [Blastocatellia bacterium]|nr:hypothetical protein [Blastocatellia bacterium]